MKIYDQISTNIRATDEISFRLMSFVPLASGVGLFSILLSKKDTLVNPPDIVFLSLFAAAITLGLFRWEIFNIRNSLRLLEYAGNLERSALQNMG